MPGRKLTIAEKKARGTYQACLSRIRPLTEVRAEIDEVIETLDLMYSNLRAACEAIRREGVLIDVVTREKQGQETRTKKLNPACRLQGDMVTGIKSAERNLVLLREEEQLAQGIEKPQIDPGFEGLD